MTEDEKRQQKVMLLLEVEEVESTLANLREKAGRIGRDMLEVGQWLGFMSPDQLPDSEYRKKRNLKRDAMVRASLGKYRSAMNFDEALALMDEIANAEKQMTSLTVRKTALGFRPVTVLHIHPALSPVAAVRAFIVQEFRANGPIEA